MTTSVHSLAEPAKRNWRQRLGRNSAWITGSVLITLALMALQPLLALPFIALFAWLSGLSLKDLRLRPFRLSHILLGVLAAFLLQAINRLAVLPLLAQILPDTSAAAASIGLVPGAWQVFWVFVPIAIISAGFGEELAARGFAMTRIATLFGDTRSARWLAMLVVAVIFGLAHFYQGPLGTAHAVWMGLALGTLTLSSGSLWVSIVAHGCYNVLTALFIVSGGLQALHQALPHTAV